jgi:hypothetical protein
VRRDREQNFEALMKEVENKQETRCGPQTPSQIYTSSEQPAEGWTSGADDSIAMLTSLCLHRYAYPTRSHAVTSIAASMPPDLISRSSPLLAPASLPGLLRT